MQRRSGLSRRFTPRRSITVSSAWYTAGTPVMSVTPFAINSTAFTGLNLSIVVTRAPSSNGALAVTVRPNRCANGSTARAWSAPVISSARIVERAFDNRLRCVTAAPSGVPRIAEV